MRNTIWERSEKHGKTIWQRRKGAHSLNTQGEVRQLDTGETHQGGENEAKKT